MNIYEIHDPYYGMMIATDEEEAVNKYIEVVAGYDDDKAELLEEVAMVDRDHAMLLYSRARGEDGNQIPIPELLEPLKSGNAEVLLVDGQLI